MKKFMAVVLSLALALSLCACGGGAANNAGGAESETEKPGPASEKTAPASEEEDAEETEDEETEEFELPVDVGGVVGVYKYTDCAYVGEDDVSEDAMEAILYTVLTFEALKEAEYNTYLLIYYDEDEDYYYGAMEFAGEFVSLIGDDECFYTLNDDGTPDEENPSAYIYEDGALYLTDTYGFAMRFDKLTDEELEYYVENGSGNPDEVQAFLEAFYQSDEVQALFEDVAEPGWG